MKLFTLHEMRTQEQNYWQKKVLPGVVISHLNKNFPIEMCLRGFPLILFGTTLICFYVK